MSTSCNWFGWGMDISEAFQQVWKKGGIFIVSSLKEGSGITQLILHLQEPTLTLTLKIYNIFPALQSCEAPVTASQAKLQRVSYVETGWVLMYFLNCTNKYLPNYNGISGWTCQRVFPGDILPSTWKSCSYQMNTRATWIWGVGPNSTVYSSGRKRKKPAKPETSQSFLENHWGVQLNSINLFQPFALTLSTVQFAASQENIAPINEKREGLAPEPEAVDSYNCRDVESAVELKGLNSAWFLLLSLTTV